MLGHSDSSVQEQVKFSWETTPAVLRSNTLLRPSLTEYLSSEAPHMVELLLTSYCLPPSM